MVGRGVYELLSTLYSLQSSLKTCSEEKVLKDGAGPKLELTSTGVYKYRACFCFLFFFNVLKLFIIY